MTWVWGDLLLVAAAFVGGVINSVAGGGSFFTFPALVFAGLPPISANATSSVALWPGSVASAVAYRGDVHGLRAKAVPLTIISLIGGLVGACLLLWTRNETFARVVPWLLLVATVLFAVSGRAVAWLRVQVPGGVGLRVLGLAQFVISVYGGFFGGGMGILMLAGFALAGMTDIHAMNGLKSILGLAINCVAVITFVAAGVVEWRPALLMTLGSIVGGYVGAKQAKRVSPQRIRQLVIATGAVMTVKFFLT